MMRNFACVLLFLLLGVPATRADRIDSLKRELAMATGEQKSKIYGQLYQLSFNSANVDSLLALMEEWAAFERQQGNAETEGKVRNHKLAVLSNYGRDEALLAEAPLQMAWFEEHEMWDYYYSAWESKATSYVYSNKLQTALHETRLMLEDAQARNNNYGRAVSYQLAGVIYEAMGQLDEAIVNLRRAYDMLKTMEMKEDMFFTVCDYLSQVYDQNGNYEESLKLTHDWEGEIMRLQTKKPDNRGYLQGPLLSCYAQRASALKGLGHYSEAWKELDKAKECLEYVNLPLTHYRITLCKAHLLLAEKKPAQALECIDSIERMGIEMGGSLDLLRADALMMLNRHADAAQIYRNAYLLKDSVFNRDMRTQLDELSTLYRLDETAMKAENERNRVKNRFIFIIITVVLVALLLFFATRYISAKRLAQKSRELEELNERLRQASQQAEDSSKMKSDFIKSISHEIRTPLNILSGFTQVITSPYSEFTPEQLKDIHHRINENTDRIVKLVNKMLELSDANSHAVIVREDTVMARDIVEDVVKYVEIASTPQVAFNWEPGEDVASTLLLTHRNYAFKALACLVDNAQKFTEQGMIAIRLKKTPTCLNFIVEDTGIGIAPDQAESIFDEFMKVDKYTDGAGIGLTVARSIARRLGGDIKLDTNYTAGARFVMSLPL